MSYSLLHVTHLLAAIFFIGTLFVEVAVLSRVRQQIEPELMQRVDKAVGARLRTSNHDLLAGQQVQREGGDLTALNR